MAKQLYDENGTPIALPTNATDAKRYRYPHYTGSVECEKCASRGDSGILSRKRYTATGECVHCATLEALELQSLVTYQAALDCDENGVVRYVIGEDDENARVVDNDYTTKMESALSLIDGPFPTTRQGAIEMGVDYYVKDVPCRTKGHLGVTTLQGDCYYCERERNTPSPRQTAIKDGRKWYIPETPCTVCNETAERHVDNGRCRGCAGGAQQSADAQIMKEQPDLIMSRDDAKMMGFKVYRTGTECHKGHRGYRYVSTGNCIDCLK